MDSNGEFIHSLTYSQKLETCRWIPQGLRLAGKLLYTFSRQKRFLSGSIFRFMNGMVCTNLRWMLDNCAELRQAAEIGQAAMGTIDSYIVYR